MASSALLSAVRSPTRSANSAFVHSGGPPCTWYQTLVANHLCSAEHRDRHGNTPLLYAVSGASGDNVHIMTCLAEAGCAPSKANLVGETALHQAARFNRKIAVEWLIQRDCSVSEADRFPDTPLHIVVCSNSVEVMHILLANEANTNRAATDGRTHLHCAAQAGAGDAMSKLLATRLDENVKEIRGWTPVVTSCARRKKPHRNN
jgi:ankyrin repeat protein